MKQNLIRENLSTCGRYEGRSKSSATLYEAEMT